MATPTKPMTPETKNLPAPRQGPNTTRLALPQSLAWIVTGDDAEFLAKLERVTKDQAIYWKQDLRQATEIMNGLPTCSQDEIRRHLQALYSTLNTQARSPDALQTWADAVVDVIGGLGFTAKEWAAAMRQIILREEWLPAPAKIADYLHGAKALGRGRIQIRINLIEMKQYHNGF